MGYEQFTYRALKVMELAKEAAIQLECPYLAPEHILLGLIKEGDGIAACVLAIFGVTFRNAVDEIREIGKAEKQEPLSGGLLPNSPHVKVVFEHSIEASKLLGVQHVGTEHLLLGLLKLEDGIPLRVFKNFGLSPEAMEKSVVEMISKGAPNSDQAFTCISDLRSYPLYGNIFVALDALIDHLDTLVFEAAYVPGLDLDQQQKHALDPAFMHPLKRERGPVLKFRNQFAFMLGFSERKPHDLSPRDYVVAECGKLVPRS